MKVAVMTVAGMLVFAGQSARAAEGEMAKPAATTETPKPGAEIEQLKGLVAEGKYKCTGTATPPGGEATHPVMAELPIKTDKELNGVWQTLNYKEKKTKENPKPLTAMEYLTYDVHSKAFVRTVVDSWGNSFTMTAQAIEGDKLTFMGDAMWDGNKVASRMTYEKKGKELKVDLETTGADGAWKKAIDLVCKK